MWIKAVFRPILFSSKMLNVPFQEVSSHTRALFRFRNVPALQEPSQQKRNIMCITPRLSLPSPHNRTFCVQQQRRLEDFRRSDITVGVEASNSSLNNIGGVRISMSTLGLLEKYVCRVLFSTTNPSWPLKSFLISIVWPFGTTISTSVVVLGDPRSAHPAPPTIAYAWSPRTLPTACAASRKASTSERWAYIFGPEFLTLSKFSELFTLISRKPIMVCWSGLTVTRCVVEVMQHVGLPDSRGSFIPIRSSASLNTHDCKRGKEEGGSRHHRLRVHHIWGKFSKT